MPRPETIQWNCKQYLGDNKVLAMEWDVRGMHFHLLNLSTQETPPGTIPADDATLRRWLNLPPSASLCSQRGSERGSERDPAKAGRDSGYDSGYDCRCNDCVWRRVKPQLLGAWSQEGERLVNRGMVETFERKERYSQRYENGTKPVREVSETPYIRIKEGFDLEVQSQNQNPQQKRKDKTGTRIPEGFKVSDAMRVFARENNLPDPDLHIAEFIDYWAAQPGSRGVKVDWDATLRNWLRRAKQFHSGGTNGKLSYEQRAEKEREIARQYAARASSGAAD